jgi:isocitrate/isopropylmalate dehydrogenase
MRRYRIAVIPGDGVGKEVIPAGLDVFIAKADLAQTDVRPIA